MLIPSTPMNDFVAYVRRRASVANGPTTEQQEFRLAVGPLDRDTDVIRYDLDAWDP